MMAWQVATTDSFDEWFGELDEAAQAEIIAKVRLVELFGPQLGRPHVDTLKGSRFANLKELRADAGKQVLRIAFAFDPTRSAILLIGGDKAGTKQKRFYQQLIAKAEALYAEHLLRINEGEETDGAC